MNKFSTSVSFLQNQARLLPKDRDEISVIEFTSSEMCKGVNGDAPDFFNRSVNARTNCIATNDPLSASHFTHPIVGVLSLNSTTWAARNFVQNSSVTSHSISNPSISKSEFVMYPLWNNSFISSGQARRNTVGMHDFYLPIMIPPIPWIDASLTPM